MPKKMYLGVEVSIKHLLPKEEAKLLRMMEEDPNEVIQAKRDEMLESLAQDFGVLPEEITRAEVVIYEEESD